MPCPKLNITDFFIFHENKNTDLCFPEETEQALTEYFDNESGLVYYNYRYYSPELGRWLSRDPIGESGGYNLYAMAGNDPVNWWDLWGLSACDENGSSVFKAYLQGFGDSLSKQLYSMTHPFANDAYENSALGQTKNADWWAYYGTRGALRISVAAISTAVALNAVGFNPWVAGGHGWKAHAGGPHTYKHIQIIIRTLNGNKHFRFPWWKWQ